jgi:four helix bundle protein
LNVERPSHGGDSSGPGKFDLEERLLDYAAAIICLTEALPHTRAANYVAGQLLRSGTSALPNHGEAQAAESAADFAHKISICLKELRESRRWLRLINRAQLMRQTETVDNLIGETEELIRIFFSSLRTVKKRTLRRNTPDGR